MYLVKPNSRTPYYQIVYFINNKRKTKSTKESLKSKALQFLANFENSLKNAQVILPKTLSEFKTEYLDYIGLKYSAKYREINNDTFNHFISFIGNVPLNSLNIGNVESFILSRYAKAKYSAFLDFRNLRAGFNYALQRNYLKVNPLSGYKFPKMPKSNPVFIDDIELRQILSKVSNTTLNDMYLCYYHTGTRLNELIHLKWKDVDLLQGIIKIRNSDDFTIKTKEERMIPLNKIVADMLKNRFPKITELNGYVFNKNGFKYNDKYVSKQFKKACRLAGFPDIHTHSLRHSFCSNLIKSNISPRIVMELAGHSNLSTALKYMHVRNESLFEAVKVLEG